MKKRRVQLDLTQRSFDKIAKLRKATEASSNAEVIRRALDVYRAVINQKGQIFIEEKDGTRARIVLLEKPDILTERSDAKADEQREGHQDDERRTREAVHADGGSASARGDDEPGAADPRRPRDRGKDRGEGMGEARRPEDALPVGLGLMANILKTPRQRIVTYLAMRRYLPTTAEMIAKNLFLTKGTVKRHLRKLIEECQVLEYDHERKGQCFRMMHMPRRRS